MDDSFETAAYLEALQYWRSQGVEVSWEFREMDLLEPAMFDPEMFVCDVDQPWVSALEDSLRSHDVVVRAAADIRPGGMPTAIALGHTCPEHRSDCDGPARSSSSAILIDTAVDHKVISESVLGVVLAHELGHSLGLSHEDLACSGFETTPIEGESSEGVNIMDSRIIELEGEINGIAAITETQSEIIRSSVGN